MNITLGGEYLDQSQPLMLPKDVAKMLDISERWVHDLADDGKLPVAKEEPYGKTRKRRWFNRSDVETYAKEHAKVM